MNKLTRERIEQYANDPRMCNINDEIREIARIALAAMDAKPVAWTDEQELRDVERGGCGYLFTCNPVTPHADERRIIKLYTAPPAQQTEKCQQSAKGNSPVILDGWQLVPTELTCAMDDAAWNAYHETHSMSDIYKALLKAAPKPE